MSAKARPRSVLQGWTPILGALLIWSIHFTVIYGAALIWPDQPIANVISIAATIPALAALAWLYFRMRRTEVTSEFTEFSKKIGLWSIWFAVAGVLFDMVPALFA